MDFATLKLGADTSGLKQAERALDDVADAATSAAGKVDGAAERMDASLDEVGASAKQAAQGMTAFERAVQQAGSRIPAANDNIAGMGGQSRLASHHVQNLAFQFQDLGVQIASGANPMTAFGQTGTQIAGIMGQAGIGVRGLIGAVASMIAVVGALAGAVALMTSDINENSKVTVTWGDTVGGIFDYVSDLIGRGVTAAFAAFGTTTTEVWAAVVRATKTAVNFIIGALTILPRTVGEVIKALRKVIADGGANAGQTLGAALSKSFKDTFQRDFVGEAAAAISPFAQARAVKRLEDDAKKAGKSAGEKAGKDFIDSLEDYIAKNTGRVMTALEREFGGPTTFPNAERELQRRIDEVYARREAERAIEMAIADRYADKFIDVATGAADIFGGSAGRAVDRLAQVIREDFPDMARELGKAFDGISEGLGQALGQIGKSFALGGAVGDLTTSIFGGNRKGATIGGASGAAVGAVIGDVIPGIGTAVGPVIGAIVGSIIGSLIKGKNNFADAIITAAGGTIFNQRGGQESIDAGLQLANSVAGQLNQMAQALGGSLSATAQLGAIGFSGSQFYFNPTGGDFKAAGNMRFATAEEAVAAAIQNAVNIGAFEGVREGTLKILQAGGDLATNIQSAIAFEQTFRDMEIALDPIGVAIRELESRFDSMRNTLKMGGATTEELARLEQWYSQERVRLANDEAAALESLGDASREATAAMRAAAQEQQRIAQERYGLETRLLQLQGNIPALRERELAALDESNRGLLEQIYALEDQRAGQEAAARAAQAAAAQAEQARQRIEAARQAALNDLRSAIGAERSIIQERLNPLRSELSRLVQAITPAAPDLVAALEVRDLLSEGLDLAARIAGAARGLMGDNEQIIAMQRDAARRELYRMAETRRIDAERIDDLIDQATQFGQAASREAMMLDRARTANLLVQLAGIQEEQARAAQAVEDERASQAAQAVRDQIALLESQIGVQERSLGRLDQIAERFLSLDNAVMSVAQALRALGVDEVPAFANGGMHGGGLAIVGEQGPELVNMGPARVFSAGQTQAIMRGQSDDEVKAELVKQNEYLRELVKLNAKQERTLREIELQGETA